MIIRTNTGEIDPDNEVAMRTYYEALRSSLSGERASWDTQYINLASYFLPRTPRWSYSDVNQGDRRDSSIINNTPTLSLNTLAAGMQSGMSSPSSKWFSLRMSNQALDENQEVRTWIETVEDIIRMTMLKSNFYQTLHAGYSEIGLYGTSVFQIDEDDDDDIRCQPWPIGSYYLSGNDKLRIDFGMRVLSMTVRQIVDKFGIDRCSDTVKQYYLSPSGGQKEQWMPVVHVVHRNKYYGDRLGSKFMPWLSVYYEMGNYSGSHGFLRRSGYMENPIIAGRWRVTGENFLGESPAMDALGDAMALQLLEIRKSQALDKIVNPPMVGDPSLMGQKSSVLPGDVTFVNMKDGAPGFKPAYQIDFKLQEVSQEIGRHEQRINDAMFKNLFLMIAESDRRQVTAEEIRAKQQEKMMVIGPIIERSTDDIFKPAIERILGILHRRGKLPTIPAIMKNKPYKIEFSSILAKAQKLLGIENIDRFMAFLGNEVAVDQGILDVVDLDETAREYANLLSLPSKLLRSPDAIAQIRANRQQQQELAQKADAANKLALAGKNLASADTGSKNALTDLLPAIGQASQSAA